MSHYLFFLLGLLCCCFSGLALAQEEDVVDTYQIPLTDAFEVHMKDAIHQHLSPDARTQFYEQYYEDKGTMEGFSIDSLLNMFGKPRADNATCQMCNNVLGLGRQLLTSAELAITFLGGLCHDSDSLSARACHGLLERLAGPLVWLFQNSKLEMPEICSILVGHGCLGFLDWTGTNESVWWELPLPPKRGGDFKPIAVAADSKHKKVLHLTDIHLDLWYEPHMNASCNEPLCCRPVSQDTKGEGIESGHWAQVKGDCDIPAHFVADSLKQIAALHPDLDAIFWTGDNVPHDVWNTTEQINLRHIHTVTGLLSVAFNGVDVFPVLGNHEAHPINLYIPETVTAKDPTQNMTWLYSTLANDYWARWMPDAEQKRTFQRGGYYAKVLTPSWKVLVLNTNTPQKENFWTVFNPHDPDGQLVWLIEELDKAEEAGQHVTLLGHIPPQHGLYDAWLHNYIRILDRYAHLITASFNGHTHDDEVVVVYNEARQPIHVTYISGSLTTYSYLNPSYAVFEMDERGQPLNSTAYLTDMDAANHQYATHPNSTTAHPAWRAEYSPLHSYRLPALTPTAWDAFLTAARTDLDLAYLYADHYHRHSAEFLVHEPWTLTEVARLVEGARRYPPFDGH